MAIPTKGEVSSVNRKARDEVVETLRMCKDASEMNDKEHELHIEYLKAIQLVDNLLTAV